jgi:hypothetical protein
MYRISVGLQAVLVDVVREASQCLKLNANPGFQIITCLAVISFPSNPILQTREGV